jgi:hypothetical protein
MTIERLPDWPIRLIEFLAESQREAYACDWEFFHCGSWVAAGVEAMTGVDIYEPFRKYEITDAESAYKAMRKGGFKSQEEYIATLFEEKPLAYAKRGDIILAPADQASELTAHYSDKFPAALAIADPPFFWALGKEGCGRAPLSTALKCYGVGNI